VARKGAEEGDNIEKNWDPDRRAAFGVVAGHSAEASMAPGTCTGGERDPATAALLAQPNPKMAAATERLERLAEGSAAPAPPVVAPRVAPEERPLVAQGAARQV
jgi:hypothetical protein